MSQGLTIGGWVTLTSPCMKDFRPVNRAFVASEAGSRKETTSTTRINRPRIHSERACPCGLDFVPTGISLRMDRLTHIPTAATDPRR